MKIYRIISTGKPRQLHFTDSYRLLLRQNTFFSDFQKYWVFIHSYLSSLEIKYPVLLTPTLWRTLHRTLLPISTIVITAETMISLLGMKAVSSNVNSSCISTHFTWCSIFLQQSSHRFHCLTQKSWNFRIPNLIRHTRQSLMDFSDLISISILEHVPQDLLNFSNELIILITYCLHDFIHLLGSILSHLRVIG